MHNFTVSKAQDLEKNGKQTRSSRWIIYQHQPSQKVNSLGQVS
jgi:hypothetical protein